MADDNLGIWDESVDFIPHDFDGFDAVVEEECLPATIHFARDSGADDALIVAADGGLDGDFVWRCGVDGRHVSRAHEGEIKGAGNGGGGEGEEVDACEEFFEFFFVLHSESLLFIHDGDS